MHTTSAYSSNIIQTPRAQPPLIILETMPKGLSSPADFAAAAALLSLVLSTAPSAASLEMPPRAGRAPSPPTAPRRAFLRRAVVAALPAGLVNAASPAGALQPKNEKLCGTGFFTNIAQYYCTDIGNISDEGPARAMSKQELGSADSLMGKLDLDLDLGGAKGDSRPTEAPVEAAGDGKPGSDDAEAK